MLSKFFSRRAASLLAVLVVPFAVSAADPKASSLAKTPANASAYGAIFHLGEDVKSIAKSKAWKSIQEDPLAIKLVEGIKKSLHEDKHRDKEVQQFLAFFEDPKNKEIPALVGDALSHEVFAYTGEEWPALIRFYQEMYGQFLANAFRQGMAGGGMRGPGARQAEERMMVRSILTLLEEQPERIAIPEYVMGFKVSDSDKAKAQLARLDELALQAVKHITNDPKFQESKLSLSAESVKIDDDAFLTVTLGFESLPIDDLAEKYEDKPDEFAKVFKQIKNQKIRFAIGIRQGYLLLVFASSTEDSIKRFGGKGEKLIDRPECKKAIARFADRKMTSFSYHSAALRGLGDTHPEDVDHTVEMAKEGMKALALPDDLEEAIDKDLEELAKQYKNSLVPTGPSVSIALATDRGWETFAFDHTKHSGKSKPTTMLEHLGGNPLLAAFGRCPIDVESYKGFVRWVIKIEEHLEKVALEKAPQVEAPLEKVKTEAFPILRELNEILEKSLLPALAQAEVGIVLDAKWKSKRWHDSFGETKEAMPQPELALVHGINDAEQFVSGLESLYELANKTIAKASELSNGNIPAIVIPKPKTEVVDGVTYAYYPIPESMGLDPQVRPTAALSKNLLVIAPSQAMAERLIKKTPFKTDAKPLADPKRPIDAFGILDWVRFVETLECYFPMIVSASIPENGIIVLADRKVAKSGENAPEVFYTTKDNPFVGEEFSRERVLKLMKKGSAILKVFRGFTVVTYREDGILVEHAEIIFRDIE